MTTRAGLVRAGSGLGLGSDWRHALGVALEEALAPLDGEAPDLLVLFASASYRPAYAELLAEAADRARATEVAGCSASGVISGAREIEQEAGVAALALRLPPGSLLNVRHVSAEDVRANSGDDARHQAADDVRHQAADDARHRAADDARHRAGEGGDSAGLAGMPARACHGIVVLADPFSTDAGALLGRLERDYPGVPIVGGLATGFPGAHWTAVFDGLHAKEEGAVVIGLGGGVGVRPLVSQGCEPIGEPWTVTDASEHIVRSIGSLPAYQVLVETIQALSPDQRERVGRNLLVGLAMDEYRDEFRRGDFLIRNLIGIDPSSGAIAIAAQPRVGQTLQFQIRDARAADEELRHMLGGLSGGPSAALLFACNGRGAGLFGAPDHDARTVRELLGPLPLAGLFCNGEIGPVGAATYVHGFTASLALIAPT